jgi:hypothetical protein
MSIYKFCKDDKQMFKIIARLVFMLYNYSETCNYMRLYHTKMFHMVVT